MQPPRRLSGLKGACRPLTRCSGQGKAQPLLWPRVRWRTTHTNEVCISEHFRIFRSACCARKSLSRSRLLGHFRLQFPCLVTGERPRRPQDAGERPRRPQDAGERPRRPQDAGERPRRPQDAGERPRRPQDAGERPRRPQDAGERPRRPQDAGERPPRRPQDAGERPRRPQDAGERPRRPQDAGERRRAPQTATGRRRAPLFSARSQPLVLDQVGGCGTPP